MTTTGSGGPGDIPDTIVELVGRYSSDMAFTATGDRLTWVAPKLPDLLGATAADLTGTAMAELLHPDDHGDLSHALERIARGDDAVLVARAHHGRGHYVPVEIHLHPHEGELGTSTVVGTMRDISDTLGLRETALRAQEALGVIAERSGDVLFLLDGDEMVLEAGRGSSDLLGWLPEEMVGIDLVGLAHPDDAVAFGAYREEVRNDTARGAVELRVRTRGGAWRWVRGAGVRITPPDVNEPGDVRMLMTLRDVDLLHREINYAWRESERLRRLLDSSIDPWMVLSPIRDRSGRIIDFRVDDANQMAADYLSWPRDRLVGTRLLASFPGVVAHGLMSHYVDAVEFGEPIALEDVIYPHPVLGESRRYSVRGTTLDGTLLLSWRDTTTASLARDELADAEAHFRGIAMRAGDALVRADDRTVLWASPGATALGLNPGSEFESAMAGMVAPESHAGLRTCGVTMTTPGGYTGRWSRAGGGPALVVRARPVEGQADQCVVVVIDEDWTDATGRRVAAAGP